MKTLTSVLFNCFNTNKEKYYDPFNIIYITDKYFFKTSSFRNIDYNDWIHANYNTKNFRGISFILNTVTNNNVYFYCIHATENHSTNFRGISFFLNTDTHINSTSTASTQQKSSASTQVTPKICEYYNYFYSPHNNWIHANYNTKNFRCIRFILNTVTNNNFYFNCIHSTQNHCIYCSNTKNCDCYNYLYSPYNIWIHTNNSSTNFRGINFFLITGHSHQCLLQLHFPQQEKYYFDLFNIIYITDKYFFPQQLNWIHANYNTKNFRGISFIFNTVTNNNVYFNCIHSTQNHCIYCSNTKNCDCYNYLYSPYNIWIHTNNSSTNFRGINFLLITDTHISVCCNCFNTNKEKYYFDLFNIIYITDKYFFKTSSFRNIDYNDWIHANYNTKNFRGISFIFNTVTNNNVYFNCIHSTQNHCIYCSNTKNCDCYNYLYSPYNIWIHTNNSSTNFRGINFFLITDTHISVCCNCFNTNKEKYYFDLFNIIYITDKYFFKTSSFRNIDYNDWIHANYNTKNFRGISFILNTVTNNNVYFYCIHATENQGISFFLNTNTHIIPYFNCIHSTEKQCIYTSNSKNCEYYNYFYSPHNNWINANYNTKNFGCIRFILNTVTNNNVYFYYKFFFKTSSFRNIDYNNTRDYRNKDKDYFDLFDIIYLTDNYFFKTTTFRNIDYIDFRDKQYNVIFHCIHITEKQCIINNDIFIHVDHFHSTKKQCIYTSNSKNYNCFHTNYCSTNFKGISFFLNTDIPINVYSNHINTIDNHCIHANKNRDYFELFGNIYVTDKYFFKVNTFRNIDYINVSYNSWIHTNYSTANFKGNSFILNTVTNNNICILSTEKQCIYTSNSKNCDCCNFLYSPNNNWIRSNYSSTNFRRINFFLKSDIHNNVATGAYMADIIAMFHQVKVPDSDVTS
ncbi:hypothetical protein P4O66_002055 [Electrophorus voltai]|uniref:Uncharacterized protein n=1 Tax=Electrophorus voltai TaxID=2609070 RepID=A0AAD8Z3W1_9TELE|nr:hypothetical protein P4O66_002055 [Electrophorus voltai]